MPRNLIVKHTTEGVQRWPDKNYHEILKNEGKLITPHKKRQ
jgi:hypothetical protein